MSDTNRALGFSGSVALALGGVSAGALPIHDPFGPMPGIRELRAFPLTALAATFLGVTLLLAAWLRVRKQAHTPRELTVTLLWWAAPLAVAPAWSGRLRLIRAAIQTAAAGLVAVALTALLRRPGKPGRALGVALLAIVLCGPVVHPWYVLWGLVPLATGGPTPAMRRFAVALNGPRRPYRTCSPGSSASAPACATYACDPRARWARCSRASR